MNATAAQGANTVSDETRAKLEQLRARIRSLQSVLVCFSGGLDSGFMLAVAHEVLGDRAVGMTATGPALSERERAEASAFASRLGARVELVDAGEMQAPGYVANGPDRCFHCKSSLYETAKAVAARLGLAWIANGTNVDDLGDYRPGLDAARQYGVVSPLLDSGLAKAEIPYGTAVTSERLGQIGGFEQDLKDLGLRTVRVRHHDTVARIEVDTQDIIRLASSPMREAVVEAGRRNGYAYVTVDLAGYRTGSHNEVLVGRRLKTIA
jgi:uncharacterized protein